MKRLVQSRTLRLFSTSIADQVLLSLGNFLVGFLLIRETTDFDYGLFVLTQASITLLIAAQNSWLSGPLTVTAPHKAPEARTLMIGSLERSLRRILLWAAGLALIVPLAYYATGAWSGAVVMVAVAGIAAGLTAMLRDYLRSVLLIYSRMHALFYADVIYVAIILAGASLAAFGPFPAVLVAVMALAIGGAASGFAAYASTGRDPGWRGTAAAAGPFWRELRPLGVWAVTGSVIYWIYSQSYNYLLAAKLGLTAVADVNAARLLLMPGFILTVGVKALLTPMASNWLAGEGLAVMMRRVKLFIPLIALLDLGYIVVVWFARDALTVGLMHKNIHDRDFLILMWAAIVMVSMVRDMLQCAAFVLGKLQSLAWLGAASAAVSLPVMWLGLSVWGPGAAMIGQLCGEMVSLVGVIWLLHGAVTRYQPRSVVA